MLKRIFALLTSAIFLGYLGMASAAQDQPGTTSNTAKQKSAGAPSAGGKWPAAGELKAEKGKIDKWEDGKVKTGGILGIGSTSLTVTNNTMIVSESGKKLSRKDLQPGREAAIIYNESDQTDQNTALVVVLSQQAKGGGTSGQQSGASGQSNSSK